MSIKLHLIGWVSPFKFSNFLFSEKSIFMQDVREF